MYAIKANCYLSLKKIYNIFQGKIGIQTYNHGQMSSGQLCNLTNYLCFNTEV